ncbi:CBS domain-containing protein [Candidatus Woesearchaeota archaeon]|jgi:predicted transcriptional regulator|nr:CBS domain-containing protein [Candidatus Woesearchaeota archaeon]MBT5272250.1 CBS domain-containing protein [Candidatus Woesearchaeota archaeon]MBT6041157.1 CBS domain-containing protein [Candidatus Woesearchaeota archaeon]MBT6336522.1 CBS domain-containing protein [Candidatus Woesearchaeota archaeon]MBT7927412.1 CBS domain-containing protein [Candidatus Woesearchaeota archaeon]
MMLELGEIKEIRKKYNMTQIEFAKLAGVSQSLIAKIESNRIDPTYTKIKKIYDAINKLNKKKEIKASELLNTKIISIKENNSLKDATKLMKKHGISQLLVFDGKPTGMPSGLISEAAILDAIMNKASPDAKVKAFMMDCPPIVNKDAPSSMIGFLLKHYQLILVGKDNKIIGIITKADFLDKVYK